MTKLGSPRGPLVRLGHPIGDYLANKELISERECHHQVKELAPSRDESAESKLFTRLSNPPLASTPSVLVITQCAPRAHLRSKGVPYSGHRPLFSPLGGKQVVTWPQSTTCQETCQNRESRFQSVARPKAQLSASVLPPTSPLQGAFREEILSDRI